MIKAYIQPIVNHLKLAKHKNYWRKLNSHNYTHAGNVFPVEKVVVGKKTYGQLNVFFFGSPKEYVKIGNYCSIARNVKFLAGGNHKYSCLSTYPFKNLIINDDNPEALTNGPIILEDDIWIGENSLILSGITIGQGAIIAAASVVTKDVPPYSIFVKGKIIKKRFSDEIISHLLDFDFSTLNEDEIENNLDLLYTDVTLDLLNNSFIKKHSKMNGESK